MLYVPGVLRTVKHVQIAACPLQMSMQDAASRAAARAADLQARVVMPHVTAYGKQAATEHCHALANNACTVCVVPAAERTWTSANTVFPPFLFKHASLLHCAVCRRGPHFVSSAF